MMGEILLSDKSHHARKDAAKQRHKENFTWGKVLFEYEQLLDKAL